MKENILSLLGSDAVAPEQFAATFRRSEYLEPEKALLLAVLEDAIGCFLEYHSAQDRIGKERFQEAEEWIMQTGDEWILSFENICLLLGLDAEYLRRGLRQWSAKMTQRKKPPRHRGLRRQAA
jgi:hypothetical protein